MKKTQAWTGLFCPKPKKGFDCEQALSIIAGDKEPDADADAAFDEATRDRVQDFLMDADAFCKTNASDARLSHWKKLAAGTLVASAPVSKTIAPPKAAAPKAPSAAKKPAATLVVAVPPPVVKPAPPPPAAAPAPAPAPTSPAPLVLPPRQPAQAVSANALQAAARAVVPPAQPAFHGFGGRVEPADDGHGRDDRGDHGRGRGRDRGNRDQDDARRQQEEAARLAKEAAERQAAFMRAHTPPAEHIALLQDPLYVLCRESWTELCLRARSTDPTIRAQGQVQLKASLTLLHNWQDGVAGRERAAVARHILRLIDELANMRDLNDTVWFYCNFVTGKWEEAPP